MVDSGLHSPGIARFADDLRIEFSTDGTVSLRNEHGCCEVDAPCYSTIARTLDGKRSLIELKAALGGGSGGADVLGALDRLVAAGVLTGAHPERPADVPPSRAPAVPQAGNAPPIWQQFGTYRIVSRIGVGA